ncbi:MAG: ABC transporter ATP-binding protein [Candidatus Aerophobetes bacterium]|nr:ABC transporter ATP-binding protein [Candidatus Aerophobetes bacterium]
MSEPLLEIKDLHVWFKVFGGILKVLDGVNFTVQPGEKVGLVGEMGCGKTTTMKAVMRLLPMPPAMIPKGEILFKGKDILKARQAELQQIRRKGISIIFQDPTAALNPVFTIGTQLQDAVRFTESSGENRAKENVRTRAIKVLKEVSLPDPERVLQNYPVQLSGGMRQRVCISMALVSTNELLIADEPGTSLDVTIRDQILRLLGELVEKRDTSVILISHALGAVRGMTDRLYVMYAGFMVEMARTEDLFAHPLHPYSQGLLAATPKLTGGGIGEGIDGRIPEYIDPPKGCRFHPRCKDAMPICKNEKPPFFKVGEGHEVACFLFQNYR